MVSSSVSIEALIFDCDDVILEPEHLHRQAYNDTFVNFWVRWPPVFVHPLYLDKAFYNDLQIREGKPKMR
jgi:beta-phosphoglucomutase-like phosphatase (HAD superfamily)